MLRLHSRTILFVIERSQSIITRLEQCRIYAYDIKIRLLTYGREGKAPNVPQSDG